MTAATRYAAPLHRRLPHWASRPGLALAAVVLSAAALGSLACGGTGAGEGAPGDTAATRPAGDDAPAAAPSPADSPATPGSAVAEEVEGDWSRPPLRRQPEGSERGRALLREARTGGHDGYDRIVFEFEDRLPEYTIRYVQDPVACGSGDRVDAGGAVALEIDLRPAAAHTEEGEATIRERTRQVELPVIRSVRITCDYEAIVTWVLGLEHRAEVRTLELSSPPRLVVDVRHR